MRRSTKWEIIEWVLAALAFVFLTYLVWVS